MIRFQELPIDYGTQVAIHLMVFGRAQQGVNVRRRGRRISWKRRIQARMILKRLMPSNWVCVQTCSANVFA